MGGNVAIFGLELVDFAMWLAGIWTGLIIITSILNHAWYWLHDIKLSLCNNPILAWGNKFTSAPYDEDAALGIWLSGICATLVLFWIIELFTVFPYIMSGILFIIASMFLARHIIRLDTKLKGV